MTEKKEKTYTPEQMQDAKKMAEALTGVVDTKRATFALMVDAMLIGAQLAEKSLTADSGATA